MRTSIACAERWSSKTSAGTRRSTTRSPSSSGPSEFPRRCPPDRLEVAIRFDAARGPDVRVLEMRGPRPDGPAARAARSASEPSCTRAGWIEARREFVQGDASVRLYERLTKADGTTAILMVSPPRPEGPIIRFGKPYAAIAKLSSDIRAFLAMAEGLRSLGLLDSEDPRLERRGRSRADRGFRRRDRRRERRAEPRPLRRGGRADRRPAWARPARRACRRRRPLSPA